MKQCRHADSAYTTTEEGRRQLQCNSACAYMPTRLHAYTPTRLKIELVCDVAMCISILLDFNVWWYFQQQEGWAMREDEEFINSACADMPTRRHAYRNIHLKKLNRYIKQIFSNHLFHRCTCKGVQKEWARTSNILNANSADMPTAPTRRQRLHPQRERKDTFWKTFEVEWIIGLNLKYLSYLYFW